MTQIRLLPQHSFVLLKAHCVGVPPLPRLRLLCQLELVSHWRCFPHAGAMDYSSWAMVLGFLEFGSSLKLSVFQRLCMR